MNLFTSLLGLYRSHGLKTPLEDFTTEILVNILHKDSEILDAFVSDVLKIEGKNFSISSQVTFPFKKQDRTFCRIDIVLKNHDSICFLENKVHSLEGSDQLSNYSELLDGLTQYKNRYLRFCTKFHERKPHLNNHDFYQFRWCNIANFLTYWNSNEMIYTFNEFLEINNMGNSTDFTLQEVLSLAGINPALSKMDAYLDKLKPTFSSMFGNYKTAKNMTQLRDHSRHIFWKEYLFGEYYSELGVGFRFSADPILLVWIWTPDANPNLAQFTEVLNGLTAEISTGNNYLEITKPLTDFLSSEEMEIEIEGWFLKAFETIQEIAKSSPQLNWNLPK